MKTTSLLIIALGLLSAPAIAEQPDDVVRNRPAGAYAESLNTTFVRRAEICGRKEIAAAELALRKSQNQEVQAFAKQVIADHTKAQESLKKASMAANISYPGSESTDGKQTPGNIGGNPEGQPGLAREEHKRDEDARGQGHKAKGSATSLETLKSTAGPNFDRAFSKLMVEDHKEAVALYESAQNAVTDPGLKQYAESTLPTLKSHLQAAEVLSEHVESAPESSVNR